MKVESFDINYVRIVLFTLYKVFCLYPSWEHSKEMYHAPENFAEVAVLGSALLPWRWWLNVPWSCNPEQALPHIK